MLGGSPPAPPDPPRPPVPDRTPEPDYRSIYAAITTERFSIPAVNLRRIDPRYLRREVAYPRADEPGTIVVDTAARYAYLVLQGGRAMRYGIAVGRDQAFNLTGDAFVERKAAWPNWRPTPEMVAREPQRYGHLRHGMPGGGRNPLGARALYLYQDGYDTYYRLHGTVEPWTIGTMASAGCIRLINQDIVDLYQRVPIGTRVVILPTDASVA
ncbi:L,D-transpeptidase [Neoroseomonas eburnea]|uniref:L,D-transpeptidase n=1 Tax=Neoroseomonas eburnea TaxID=1346889 RepID=UPI001BAC9228